MVNTKSAFEPHTENIRTEPGYLSWLRIRASAAIEALLKAPEGGTVRGCREEISQALFLKLQEVSRAALEVLYYNGDIGDGEAFLCSAEQQVYASCPGLMERIRQTERFFCTSLAEALSRIDGCRNRIEDVLLGGKTFSQIRHIRFGAGDLHNCGRQVLVIDSDAGSFVYKPHPLPADEAMRQLSETFFPGLFYVPRTVCGDGFGFCEYVENRPAGTEEEAATYYYRLGGFCAVSRMLGSSDLHLQNMLCRDATPVPIDCETAFSPVFSRDGELPSVEAALIDTLYTASLLPGRSFGCERGFLFDTSDSNVSAPVVNGERKTLKDCFDSFIFGFRCAFRQGMRQRQALLSFACQLGNFPVRAVPRATAGYMKLLIRTRTWKWVSSPELEKEVHRVLSAATTGGYVPGAGQAESETRAILRGDIPCFMVQMDGHDLCDMDGMADKNCVAASPREHLLRCLRMLSEQDMEFHCRLFQQALSRVLSPKSLSAQPVHSVQPFGNADCVRHAEAVAKTVLNELLPGPRGGLCCFTLLPGKEDAMEMAPYNFGHGRSGIGIFLAAMLKNSTNKALSVRLQKTLDEIVPGMCEEAELLVSGRSSMRNDPHGLRESIAGILLSADLIWRYTGSEASRRLCGELSGYRDDIPVILPQPYALVRDEQKEPAPSSGTPERLLPVDSPDGGTPESLLPVDSLDGGNCALIDSLLESGRTLQNPEQIQKSRKLLTAMAVRAKMCGGYQFVPLQFAPVPIPGLYSGLSGVGYTLLRQVDPDLKSLIR